MVNTSGPQVSISSKSSYHISTMPSTLCQLQVTDDLTYWLIPCRDRLVHPKLTQHSIRPMPHSAEEADKRCDDAMDGESPWTVMLTVRRVGTPLYETKWKVTQLRNLNCKGKNMIFLLEYNTTNGVPSSNSWRYPPTRMYLVFA